jgi:hypothetical protein
VPGDPRNNYLARMEYIPGSDEVMIQQLNRLQNTNTVWVGSTKTMDAEKYSHSIKMKPFWIFMIILCGWIIIIIYLDQ